MVQSVRGGLFSSLSWIISKQLLYASKRQKHALEFYLFGYGYKMARWTIDNWRLVTGTLVRLFMKHKVGFGVEDLKSFIVSCLVTLFWPINLYSITGNMSNKNCWSNDHVLFFCTMQCTAPIPHQQSTPPWTETSKQAGRRKNWDLEQSSVTIIICIVFLWKRKESRPNTTNSTVPIPRSVATRRYTPMADFSNRFAIHYPVSTGL